MVGLERERGAGCHAFFLWKNWRVWRGVEGGALLSIFGCKYRLICNEVSRSMWVTGFNGILCSKWFRSQRQIINWLTSLAEFTILLQLTNVSPCCFCCIVTMRNALKQFLDFPIIWSWRQFSFLSQLRGGAFLARMATLYLEEKENDASSFDLFVFVPLQAVEFR